MRLALYALLVALSTLSSLQLPDRNTLIQIHDKGDRFRMTGKEKYLILLSKLGYGAHRSPRPFRVKIQATPFRGSS